MTKRSCYLGLFGLCLALSTGVIGCPGKDAMFEPVQEVQLIECISDAECDDGNVCTADICDELLAICVITSLDGVATPMAQPSECVEHTCEMGVVTANFVAAGIAVQKQNPGDCRQVVCDGAGHEVEIDDDEDVNDDGLTCTLDACSNGVPMNPNAPKDTPCGVNLACDDFGQCVGCSDDTQCSGEATVCTIGVCNKGVCESKPVADGLPVEPQTAGDCKMTVCDKGSPVDVPDSTDPMNDGNDCTTDVCNGATPAHLPMPAATACNGKGVCDEAGHCLGAIGNACATDVECASGHCVDGVCCDTACDSLCMACNVNMSLGTCTYVPFPKADDLCDSNGTKVCNGMGSCELANGQPCNSGAKACASGQCDQGKCKSTTGQPCDTDAHCVSGVCASGVCT